jgi:putative PIN family toxin of toxin-antitoxin system
MIFLQAAARSTGPAAALLELVENGTLKLLLSAEILEEIADVLRRPELTTKFKSLTPQLVDEFLDRLQHVAETIDDVAKSFKYDRDPKDEKYIDLAIAAKADVLVSRDNDLLALREPDSPLRKSLGDANSFRIMDPVELLHEIRAG